MQAMKLSRQVKRNMAGIVFAFDCYQRTSASRCDTSRSRKISFLDRKHQNIAFMQYSRSPLYTDAYMQLQRIATWEK